MAKLYRPGGPRPGEDCTVQATRMGLDVVVDGLTVSLPYERLDGKLVGFDDAWVALSATLPDGTVEVWVQREFLTELTAYESSFSPGFRARIASLRGTQRARTATRWGLRGGGLVALALLGWFVFGGGLSTVVVDLIPISLEEKIGEMAVSQVTSEYGPCEDPELVGTVAAILDALVAQTSDSGYTFELRVLRSEDVNAFALPGGKVFVLSGLLEMAEDPSEVAAVMGHEMQHVLGRHGLRGMVQQAGVGVVMGILLGDGTELAAMIGAAAGKLGVLKFGRDQERDADRVGLDLLASAGFDPGGASRFFGKLATHGGDDGSRIATASALVSTHPASTERMERLAEISADLPRPAAPHLHDRDWASLKGRCSVGAGTE